MCSEGASNMPKFRVKGCFKENAEDVELIIEATSYKHAERIANQQGIMVSDVLAEEEPLSTVPETLGRSSAPKKKSKAKFVAIVTIVAIFLLSCSCLFSMFIPAITGNSASAPTTKVDTSNAIDAMNISDDFENNKLAAETKYKNMGALFVTGTFYGFRDLMEVASGHEQYEALLLESRGIFDKQVAIRGLSREYCETLNKGDEVTLNVKFVTQSWFLKHPVFKVVN